MIDIAYLGLKMLAIGGLIFTVLAAIVVLWVFISLYRGPGKPRRML